jgi:hypothetical protein
MLAQALSSIKKAGLGYLNCIVRPNMLSIAAKDCGGHFSMNYQSVADVYVDKPEEEMKFEIQIDFLHALTKTKTTDKISFFYDGGTLAAKVKNAKGRTSKLTLPLRDPQAEIYITKYEELLEKMGDERFEFRVRAGEFNDLIKLFNAFVDKNQNYLTISKITDDALIFKSSYNQNIREEELKVGKEKEKEKENHLYYLEGIDTTLKVHYKQFALGTNGFSNKHDVTGVVSPLGVMMLSQVTEDYVFYLGVTGTEGDD